MKANHTTDRSGFAVKRGGAVAKILRDYEPPRVGFIGIRTVDIITESGFPGEDDPLPFDM